MTTKMADDLSVICKELIVDFLENLMSFLGLFGGVLPMLGLIVLVHFVLTALGGSRRDASGQSKTGSGDLGAPGGDGADGF